MQENLKLTREQVVFLTFLAITGNIVYSHTWIADFTGRASWVAAFLGVSLLIPFSIWIFYLTKYYPKDNVFVILEKGLGKYASKPIIIFFILINIAVAVAQLNIFTSAINTFLLHFTPAWAIMLFIVLMGTVLASGGIQTFGRLTEILAIVGIVNFFAAFFLAPKYIRIDHIIPIFDTTISGFIMGTIFITGSAAEGLLLLMVIVRYIPDSSKHYMWPIKGIILSAVVIAFAIFIIIGMMSLELAKRVAYGGINPTIIIQIRGFIQGLELFIVGAYQFIAVGKITLSIYIIREVGKKLVSDKLPNFQLVIIALMILIPSIWLSSYNKAYYLAVFLGSYVLLPFVILVLLLASIGVVVNKKKAGSELK